MNVRNIFCFIVFGLLYSCGSTARDEETSVELSPEQIKVQQLQQEVLALHDEVMPHMGHLVSLKEKMNAKNQQLKRSGDEDAGDKVILNDMIITNLDQAHEGMMQWMRAFEPTDIQEDTDSSIKYLEQEKQKMLLIQEQVNNAIKAASTALEDGEK